MMKKALLVAFATLLISSVATTAMGDGNLRLILGGTRLDTDFAASDGQSVQDLVTKMGGLSVYDSKTGTLEVEKPLVNVLILEGVQQYKNKGVVFSNPIKSYAEKDVPRSFNVFVEVDEAPVSKDLKMRLFLIGPDGKEVDRGKEWSYSTKNGNSFYFSEPFIATKLDQYGTYRVQVKMKTDVYDNYVVVGENSFTVGR